MSSDAVIRADGIGKRYTLGSTHGVARYRTLRDDLTGLGLRLRRRRPQTEEREFWALKEVSFEIDQGETVGIIGRNGAGKSTLLKILAGITPPTMGRGVTTGRVGSLLEVGTGFHPELTGRENIMLSGAVMGMRRTEILGKFDQIVDFSGLHRFIDTPVKRYSSGMYMRLAFAVAAHLEPEILLVDEVLAVGDAEFQKRCLGRMEELSGKGRTVLFVSHSMPSVVRLCPRVLFLDGGSLAADASASVVVARYLDGGHGSSAERLWADPTKGPGNDYVRLRGVRVLDQLGRATHEVDIRQPTYIEVEYWNLSPDPTFDPIVTLYFYGADNTCLFVANDAQSRQTRARAARPSLVRSRCEVPGNLLAEGPLVLTVAVVTWNPNVVHAREYDVVSFHVLDVSTGDGVRAEFAGDYEGLLRPMFDWDVVESATKSLALTS